MKPEATDYINAQRGLLITLHIHRQSNASSLELHQVNEYALSYYRADKLEKLLQKRAYKLNHVLCCKHLVASTAIQHLHFMRAHQFILENAVF